MTQPKVMPKLSAGDPASVILPQSKPTTGRSKSLSRLPSKLQPADQRSRRRLGGAEESSGASVCIVARVTREQREFFRAVGGARWAPKWSTPVLPKLSGAVLQYQQKTDPPL